MGDISPRSADVASTDGSAGTTSPGRPTGASAPSSPRTDPSGSGNGFGGGGALPRKKAFGAETVFRGVSLGAGLMVLVIIVAIATFLIVKAIPALEKDNANFLTTK